MLAFLIPFVIPLNKNKGFEGFIRNYVNHSAKKHPNKHPDDQNRLHDPVCIMRLNVMGVRVGAVNRGSITLHVCSICQSFYLCPLIHYNICVLFRYHSNNLLILSLNCSLS